MERHIPISLLCLDRNNAVGFLEGIVAFDILYIFRGGGSYFKLGHRVCHVLNILLEDMLYFCKKIHHSLSYATNT